jgi:hypothetical protein
MSSATALVVDFILKHPYDEKHEGMADSVARMDSLLMTQDAGSVSVEAHGLLRELSLLKYSYQSNAISAQAYLDSILEFKNRAWALLGSCH